MGDSSCLAPVRHGCSAERTEEALMRVHQGQLEKSDWDPEDQTEPIPCLAARSGSARLELAERRRGDPELARQLGLAPRLELAGQAQPGGFEVSLGHDLRIIAGGQTGPKNDMRCKFTETR